MPSACTRGGNAMPGQAAGDSPGFIAPMLATPAAGLPPDADEFVAEVKWDGLRACIAITSGRIRAWSRTGRDITAAYPELGALTAVAGRRSLVLDGEIVALSGPRPDFTLLQRRMRAGRPGAGLLAAVPVTLIIFDVLRSGRDHLTGSPYVLRRALLEDLGVAGPGRRAGAAHVPGRCRGTAGRHPRAGPGGNRAQAARLAVPPRAAHPRVAEDPEHPRGRGAGRRLAARRRHSRAPGRVGAHGPAPAGRPGVCRRGRQRPAGGRAARADRAAGVGGAVGLAVRQAACRPRSPGGPGGPGPSWPPRWPTWNAPPPGGSASRSGAACGPASS